MARLEDLECRDARRYAKVKHREQLHDDEEPGNIVIRPLSLFRSAFILISSSGKLISFLNESRKGPAR